MTDVTPTETGQNQGGNLTDFVVGITKDNRLDIEVSIRQSGKVVLFHSHPFKEPIAWFEYNLSTRQLFFMLEDGSMRDLGLPLTENVSLHMHNAHQILMVQMDPETGQAAQGEYIPLILHHS